MSKMIFGLFKDRGDAENAINALENAGFDPREISVVMKDTQGARDVENNTGAQVADGATAGAATGAAIGGLTGLLIGIGALVIPGIGALLIAGPLVAALGITGTVASTLSGAATGALAGGLIGALVKLGFPEEDAKIYEAGVKSGSILVAVPEDESNPRDVGDILESLGAEQVKAIDLK